MGAQELTRARVVFESNCRRRGVFQTRDGLGSTSGFKCLPEPLPWDPHPVLQPKGAKLLQHVQPLGGADVPVSLLLDFRENPHCRVNNLTLEVGVCGARKKKVKANDGD